MRQLEISLAIDGHHKGLPDPSKWKNDTSEFYNNQNAHFAIIKDASVKDMRFVINDLELKTPAFSTQFDRDLFIRYLFSALTDADWLDTEAHFKPEDADVRYRRDLPIDSMIEKLNSAIAQKAKDILPLQ